MHYPLSSIMTVFFCQRESRGHSIPAIAAACVLAAVSGCEREGVQTHEVDKGVERVPDPVVPAADQAEPDVPNEDPPRPWIVPEGWVEEPAPRAMRLATYLAPDSEGTVEVAVSRFAGRVGGELANINRWRGQMGLGPIDLSELDASITRFSAPGYEGYETRIESPSGVMLAAGVYEDAIDQTWFVRATVSDPAGADRLQSHVFGMARSIAGLDE